MREAPTTRQVRLERRSPSYWRVTFDHPPLDGFVEALAMRISSFDKQAIANIKSLVDRASLPPDEDIALEWSASIASVQRPASQNRMRMLMERGFHWLGDVEDRLGFHVGQLGG